MDLDMQAELLGVALDALDAEPDLVNQVLEVTLKTAGDDQISLVRYG